MTWKEDQIKNEIQIMKQLDHPNICKLHDYYYEPNFIYIVMEILNGGDLLDENRSELKYNSEQEISKIMKQILSALNYLHLKKICHRDIKSENILYKSENSDIVKLIDFGSATEFSQNIKMSEVVGTAYYMAPEVINGSYTEKCDIWACGVLMNILLTGLPPYNGDSEEEILEKIKKGGYDPNQNCVLESISLQAKSLLSKMLQSDYMQRPSAAECLNDEWINNCQIKIDLSKYNKQARFITNYKQKNMIEVIATKYLISHFTLDEEIEELRNLFEEIDSDKSGTIQKEEMINFLQKMYPMKNDIKNDVENIFYEVDLDGSGTVEYSEFVTMFVKRKQLISEEMLKKTFASLDLVIIS